MRKLKRSNIEPLVIILFSIVSVFVISRLITFSVMVWQILPPSLFGTIGNFRLHHFVYGNILITVTSFFAIGLGVNNHRNWFALFYGIGLGLVLDEFLLWAGDVRQLTNNVVWIPYSLSAVGFASLFIASIIMVRLYKIKRSSKVRKLYRVKTIIKEIK